MGYKLLSALVLGALSTLPVAGTVFLLVKIVVDSVDAILMPVFASAHVACGEGGEVFTNTTFTSKNKEVRVVTRACPGFVERRSLEKRVTSSNLQKRQDIICSYDGNIPTLAGRLYIGTENMCFSSFCPLRGLGLGALTRWVRRPLRCSGRLWQ